ncbi:MAG: right-handed parallel beta-helix repeat-containing protein, partial [Pirellulaceae bacterium]|nr:right-handed parallel beta-helix repeat-containing protein [Pirellulaceae bacterium]
SGSGYGLAVDTSNAALTSCTFSGNSVGLYASQNSLLTVTNSNLTANTLWGASVTPTGNSGETNTFSGCTLYSNAGGLTLISATDGDVLLRDATVIRDNTAAGLHFENCNQAVNDQASGANWSSLRNLYGISSNLSTLAISNVTLSDSTSYGIRCEDSTVSMAACTLTGEFGVYADVTNDSLTIETSVFDSGSTPGVGRRSIWWNVRNEEYDDRRIFGRRLSVSDRRRAGDVAQLDRCQCDRIRSVH